MTDEAMTAVERVEAYLAYRQASEDDGCVDVLSEADLTYGDLRTLLTLARQSVGVEAISSVPLDAFHGGARVLGAIKEVLKYGGSMVKAIDAGECALSDLRPRLTSVRTSDLTEEEVIGDAKP